MKDKFFRILSPITIGVIFILDCAVVGYSIFAVKKVITLTDTKSIFFAFCVFIALIVGILVTKEIFSNGIKFYSDEMEFTDLDCDNIVAYEDIESIETQKDTKPSFVKNFYDRHAKIIINKKDGGVMTVDVGLVTKGTLEKISKEINSRIEYSAE